MRKPQNWLWNTWFLQLLRQPQEASLAILCSSWWIGCESHKQSYKNPKKKLNWREQIKTCTHTHTPIRTQIDTKWEGETKKDWWWWPENLLDEQTPHGLVSVTMPSSSDTVVRSWPWPRHLPPLSSMRERKQLKIVFFSSLSFTILNNLSVGKR